MNTFSADGSVSASDFVVGFIQDSITSIVMELLVIFMRMKVLVILLSPPMALRLASHGCPTSKGANG